MRDVLLQIRSILDGNVWHREQSRDILDGAVWYRGDRMISWSATTEQQTSNGRTRTGQQTSRKRTKTQREDICFFESTKHLCSLFLDTMHFFLHMAVSCLQPASSLRVRPRYWLCFFHMSYATRTDHLHAEVGERRPLATTLIVRTPLLPWTGLSDEWCVHMSRY